MKYIAVILQLCLTINCYRSANALTSIEEIASSIQKVYEITKNIIKFSTYYPQKDFEAHLGKLDNFENNLTALATSISSLKKLMVEENLKINEVIEILSRLTPIQTLLKDIDNGPTDAEKRLMVERLTFEHLSLNYDPTTSVLKKFYNTVPDAFDKLSLAFERLLTNVKDDEDRKKTLKEVLNCGSKTISGMAKDFLVMIHSIITYTNQMYSDAMLPELYMLLKKSADRATDFPKVAELNMARAIAASLLAQFCVDNEDSTNVDLEKKSGERAATMIRNIFTAFIDLSMALEDTELDAKARASVKTLLTEKWKNVNKTVASAGNEKEKQIQIHTNFMGFAKTLWENLNKTHGGKADIGVYITQNKDTTIDAGEEYFMEEIEPFKVFVHWTPRNRRIDRVKSEYYDLFVNSVSYGKPCKNDGSVAADWARLDGLEIKKSLYSIIPYITNNKIPFMLISNVVFEFYGNNAFRDEACFLYDIFIGY